MRLPTLRRPAPLPPAGLPLPDAVEVEARRLRVGEGWRATLGVTGYPRQVGLGWLEPLVAHPGPVDVSLHVEPIPPRAAADRLRRQLARLESTRRLDAAKGRLGDPALDVSAEDARELAARLARGEGRLFSVGVYATVRGADGDDLDRQTTRLRALLDSLLLDAAPAVFRQTAGWLTTLPLGLDLLGLRRTMDTAALAAAFPFASADVSHPGGVLYGRNARSSGLVFWDRWGRHNYNSVVLARSGAGKSYFAKSELLRHLYTGVEAFVIDPEDEYARLAAAVGGAVVRLGAPGVRLNPFDLADEPDALARRGMFVHTLVGLLLGAPVEAEACAALDRAVLAAYAARGVGADPRTHRRPPPVLADLAAALRADPDPAAAGLATRLYPFTDGTHRGLFDGPTTTAPEGHLVVLSMRDLPEELRGAGTLLALDAVWRQVADPNRRRRRLVLVDEAWLLMHDEAGARFLYRLAKAARKHWCGLTVVSQDAADLLATDLGAAVVANAATQVLMAQAPQALPALSEAFRLSEGEARFLLSAGRGEGLLLGGERVAFCSVASLEEEPLLTTDPTEVHEWTSAEERLSG
jgi:type IV secretory pathway VirB4 component